MQVPTSNIECNFSAINLFQFSSAKHVHAGFTSTCAFITWCIPLEQTKAVPALSRSGSVPWRSQVSIQATGMLWSHRETRMPQRHLSPAKPLGNRGGSRVPVGA